MRAGRHGRTGSRCAGRPEVAPRRLGFDSYTYVLEAAASGAWHRAGLRRYFIETRRWKPAHWWSLETGFVEFDSAYYGVLSREGTPQAAGAPVPRLL